MSSASKIKVRIRAYSRIEYSQIHEITPEQFAEYEAICESDSRNIEAILADKFGALINPFDICDADDFEDLEIFPVDAAGKALP